MSSLQDIFRQHFPAYAASRKLHPRERRAASCISQCYGPALGTHILRCPEGHFERIVYHACRHRSCPRCAQAARARWLDAQLARLLPCPHHHVVFTLPHSLLPLWEFNRKDLTELFFECVRDTLLTLLGERKRLGAMPGILMSLHTWGRNLSHHPHMHCLVTAGGLSSEGHWVASRDPLLVHHKPLRELFRGKFLGLLNGLLRDEELALPPCQDRQYWHDLIATLYKVAWNLKVLPAYPHGEGVSIYLARYVKGGPIADDRRLTCRDGRVRMPYTDHRQRNTQHLELSAAEFISRILWHAPPQGQHTTRHAGLYCGARMRLRVAAAAELAKQPGPWPRPRTPAAPAPTATAPAGTTAAPCLPAIPTSTARPCPVCSAPLLRWVGLPAARRRSEISQYRLQYRPIPPPLAAAGRCPTPRSTADPARRGTPARQQPSKHHLSPGRCAPPRVAG